MVPGREVEVAPEGVPARAAAVVERERLGLEVEAGVQQVGVDPRALAGLQAADVGAEDAHRQQRGAMLVGGGKADRGRPLVASRGDQAGERLDQEVLARSAGHRPARPVAGRRGVDDIRIQRPNLVVAEPEPVHDARPEVLHHHVGALEQAQDQRLAVRVLEVDRERALVAVGGEIEGADAVDERVRPRPVALVGARRSARP